MNHAFDNDEANALDTRSHELEYLWQDKQNLVAGRMGLGCDLRLNDRLAINIEGNANVLSASYKLIIMPPSIILKIIPKTFSKKMLLLKYCQQEKP